MFNRLLPSVVTYIPGSVQWHVAAIFNHKKALIGSNISGVLTAVHFEGWSLVIRFTLFLLTDTDDHTPPPPPTPQKRSWGSPSKTPDKDTGLFGNQPFKDGMKITYTTLLILCALFQSWSLTKMLWMKVTSGNWIHTKEYSLFTFFKANSSLKPVLSSWMWAELICR